ncbi:MAG: carboxypeptidase-like regulatory domain-containing protein, partial [Calditrichia bacterium]|nr:carboxypeptidase-like regulatory domain-containing protein [Calditrichia bacterium]
MKLSLIIVLFLFITTRLFASVIVGKISSSINGAPIIGANIYLENTSFGAVSNNKGEFEIKNVPPGEYTIIATYVGYKLKNNQAISVKPDKLLRCDLEMDEEIYQADNIVVTGTRS